MHIIKALLYLAPCVLSVAASAKTIYSGEFDYKKFEPSSAYFAGTHACRNCEIMQNR